MRTSWSHDGVDLSIAVRTDLRPPSPTRPSIASGAAAYRFEIEGTAAPALDRPDALAALETRPVAVHVGTLGLVFEPSGSSLEGLVAALPPDTLVMLDPNARPSAIARRPCWRARIRRLSTRADVIRVSVDDLEVLDDTAAPLDVARALADDGALVLLTDGGTGAPGARRAVPLVRLPLPASAIVDTVGAGDSFGGAFLAWWLDRGHDRAALGDAPTATRQHRWR